MYIHICTYICVYTYIYIYVYTCINIGIHVYLRTYICTYVRTSMQASVSYCIAYIQYKHAWLAYMHMPTYIYIYIHMYIYVCIPTRSVTHNIDLSTYVHTCAHDIQGGKQLPVKSTAIARRSDTYMRPSGNKRSTRVLIHKDYSRVIECCIYINPRSLSAHLFIYVYTYI